MTATATPPEQDTRRAADERLAERQADRPRAATSMREHLERLLQSGVEEGVAIERAAETFGVTASDLRAASWFTAAIARGSAPQEPEAAEPEPVAAEPDQLDAVEADARRRIVELEAARQRLALPAVSGDAEAARELASVESELTAARAQVEHAELARVERGRREAEARETAEREAQAAALADAEKLAKRLSAQGAKFDEVAAQLAREVASYAALHRRHHDALVAAGQRPYGSGGLPSSRVSGALRYALREAGAGDAITLTGFTGLQVAPLAGPAQ